LIKSRSDVPVLLKHLHAKAVCEIGVRDGGYFKTLLIDGVKKAYAIDIWDEFQTNSQNDIGYSKEKLTNSFLDFKKKFESDKRVVIIKELSQDAHHQIKNKSLDFIYIDADHTYEAVFSDLVNFYPKLRKGGVIAGHDFISYSFRGVKFGVIDAVIDFINKHGLYLHLTSESRFKSFFIYDASKIS
jgi:hypothetical protein